MRNYLKKLLPDHHAISENRWLKPFQSTLLHPRLWHLNRHSAAGAVAAGLFCGLIPGPLQMLGAAFCALIFRVNLPLSMFVTLYTNPLTIVPIYFIAYQLGRWLTGDTGAFIAPPELIQLDFIGWISALLDWMLQVGQPLLLGLPALAVLLAISGYFACKLFWRIHLIRAWRRRHRA